MIMQIPRAIVRARRSAVC